jgi:murein DD-endopeptidase MepM/ murein hydrolase activator NlpD
MRIRRLIPLVIALTMAVVAVPNTSAHALTVGEVEAKVKKVKLRLTTVGDQLEVAGGHLEDANAAIAQHLRALRNAKQQLARLGAGISERAALLYMLGSDQYAVMADSTNINVLTDKIGYLEQLGHGQQGAVEDIKTLRVRSRDEMKALRGAQARASAQQRVLQAKRSELSSSLNEYTRLAHFLASFGPRVGAVASRSDRGIVCPIPGGAPVSNDFGAPRRGGPHTGNDVHAGEGTPLQAVLPGTIADLPGGWAGLGIMLRDIAGNEWLYAHNSVRYVHIGERVQQGELIGRVGNTGHSFGPHLHFEYHPAGGAPVDPYPILSKIC